jgi:hypothetical protein
MDMSFSHIINELAGREMMLGIFLAGAGLVFMLMGLRIFKTLIAVSFAVIGFGLGMSLPAADLIRIVLGIVGALGLAVVGSMFIRFSVGLLAGGWAVALALHFMDILELRPDVVIVASVFVFVVVVSLSFVLYNEILALVTSFEGAMLIFGGVVILCSQSHSLWIHIRPLFLESVLFVSFLLLAITLSGFYFQTADLRKRQTGMEG